MADNHETSPEFAPAPASSAIATDMPQFSTVEYADTHSTPAGDRCRICSNLISGDYFRINGQMACASCAQQSMAGQPANSHAAFLRGLLVGGGGALVGLILYSAVGILTGWTIGYLGLAVGWLVGKGMMKGSNGLGGRRYQIAAVLLTYAAISFSAIPMAIAQYGKTEHKAAATASSDGTSGNSADAPKAPSSSAGTKLAMAVGTFLIIGLASPFLEFTGNVGNAAIGLFILFIGLRIAWTITSARRLTVDGPYGASAP